MQKEELTLKQIRAMRKETEKAVLVLLKKLEDETELSVININTHQKSGWTDEVSIDLDYES